MYKPIEIVVDSSLFCLNFCTRNLLVCGEGRIRENASKFEEKSWGLRAWWPLVWRAEMRRKRQMQRREREREVSEGPEVRRKKRGVVCFYKNAPRPSFFVPSCSIIGTAGLISYPEL